MKLNNIARGVLLVVAAFILLFAPALAAEVNDVSVTVGDKELTDIGIKKPQVVTFSFMIDTNETLDAITADFSPLTKDPQYTFDYQDIDLLPDCFIVYEEDGSNISHYNCTKEDLVMSLSSDTVTVPLEIEHGETIEELNFSKTFEIDNTEPEVTEIRTSYCEDDNCFIGNYQSSKVTFTIEDDTGSFDRQNIFFKLGGSDTTYKVRNCSGNQCYGYVHGKGCESGSVRTLTIGSFGGIASSDDARNPLTGKLERDVICDEFAPGEQEIFELENGSPAGKRLDVLNPNSQIYTHPKEGDSIRMHLIVSEDQTEVSAEANFSTLTGSNKSVEGSCEEMTGKDAYNCTWAARDIKPGEHELLFTFADGVGQENTLKKTLLVDAVESSSKEKTPKFFADVKAKSGAPDGYNRIALGLAKDAKPSFHFPMFATYTREMNTGFGGYDIEVLSSSIDKNCILEYPNGSKVIADRFFDDFKIRNQYPRNTPERSDNAIDILFSGNSNQLPDSSTIYCNVSAHVRDKKQNTVYEDPTEFRISIPLKLKNSALGDVAPGEKYAAKIKELEGSLEDHRNAVDKIRDVHEWSNRLCSLKNSLNSGKQAASHLEGVGKILSQINKAAGEAVTQSSNFVRKTLKSISSSETVTFTQKFLGPACFLSQCSLVEEAPVKSPDEKGSLLSVTGKPEWASQLEDTSIFNEGESGGVPGFGNDVFNKLTENVGMPNPKDSVLVALGTMCLPAIAEHYANYISMLCGKLICMKQQAAMGLSISTCEKMQGRYICSNVLGESMELFGPTRVVSNLMDNADALIQGMAPNLLQMALDNLYCKSSDAENLDGTWRDWLDIFLCHIPQSVGEAMNMKNEMTSTHLRFDFSTSTAKCSYATCDIQQDPDGCSQEAREYESVTGIEGMLDQVTDTRTNHTFSLDAFGTQAYDFKSADAAEIYDLAKSPEEYGKKIRQQQEQKFESWEEKNQPSILFEASDASDYAEKMAQQDPASPCGLSTGFEQDCTNYKSNKRALYEQKQNSWEREVETYKKENYDAELGSDHEKWAEAEVESKIQQFCAKKSTSKDDCANLEEAFEKGKKELEELEDERQNEAYNEAVKWAIDVGVNILFENTKFETWASTANWAPGFSEWVSENMDVDTWVDKACSVDVQRSKGSSEGNSGSEVQCADGLCMPVLTMAGERFEMDDDVFNAEYVYTLVFHAGNVEPPNEDVPEMTFELYLDGEKKTYLSGEDGEKLTLPFHSMFRLQKSAKSNTTYEEFCVEFDRAYPPGRADGKKKFCRDLRISTTGDSDFDTGSRAPKDYLDPSKSSSSSASDERQYSFKDI
ncbi:MAG: hypothetical protein ACLFTH_02555 [Candidatus Woesearchaeota archaeon]